MTDETVPGEFGRLKRAFLRLSDLPAVKYLKWSRYTKGAYKKMWKGLLKSLKGIAYIMILLYSVREIPDLPLGMGVLVILIGLKGVYNVARGIQMSRKARSMAEKSKGPRDERRWRYFMLWTHSTVLIALVSLSFLFIVEHFKAPQVIRGDHPWYMWPFIYTAIWIVWSVVTRSMVIGGARAFKVGDRLAKVHHDRKMLADVIGKDRNGRFILASVYVPLFGLAFMVILIIFAKVLLRFLLEKVFEIENATSIGEEMTRMAFGSGFTLSDIDPFFGTWFGPLILYLVVVFLICVFAYLRSFAMIRANYRNRFHSHLGRRIVLANELKKQFK
ncbi:MAG: hypothetical protein JXA22_00550 [Candidatus Thermoplasmatota archaeon]|nr:hypothetical protein [Candidatus Thermoplasmatota archaeon]